MNSADLYLLLADIVLCLHFLIVAFIIVGFAAIILGYWQKWLWIYNRTFRNAHLFAIGIVVLQAWFGALCALTTWESALREKAGQAPYPETFVQYWLHRLLFFDAAPWVFTTLYSVFGALVVIAWSRDRLRRSRA